MSDETRQIDLTEYMNKAVSRRYEIEGTLSHIHGEHDKRVQLLSEMVYSEVLKITEDNKETAKIKEKIEKRAKQRAKPETVHTFPKDEDGNLLVPLGGRHGYLYGALQVALLDLYKDKLQDRTWSGYGISTFIKRAIFVLPEWITVGTEFTNPPDDPKRYMVQTKGISGGMMNTYYDFVEKTDFSITIEMTNEKIPEDIFLSLLAHTQRLGIGPKGRGRMTFSKVVRTK